MKKNIFILISIFLMIFIPNISHAVSANNPVIISGLTPVIFNGNTIIETENTNEYWFNYENGKWANAKTDDGSIYVWIPRFTYKIVNDKISIRWSQGKDDDISDGYLRHPAFFLGGYNGGDPNSNANFNERNGERRELTGFWVQKYLATEDRGYIQSIQGGTPSKKDLFSAFDDSIRMISNTVYGFTQSGTYTGLIKASQWGAISYLTSAKGNANSSYSTTGNVTGIYDINGSTAEFVSAVVGTPDNAGNLLNENYLSYVDVITLDDDNTESNNNVRLKDYYGFAVSETSGFTSLPKFIPNNNDAYFIRGGVYGLFGYGNANGEEENIGFRTTISILTEELNNEIAFFDTETSVIEGDYIVIGVDFTVNKEWNFIDKDNDGTITNDDLFKRDLEDNANIDLECIYGTGEWAIKDLNASFIKLIRENNGNLNTDIPQGTLPAGKYTMVVRVGGIVDDSPVIRKIENLTAKIIVNKIMLESSGVEIKIGNISNNKVLLNIYGEAGTTQITEVRLVSAPLKKDYSLGESLSLYGGSIVPILGGNISGARINLTIENVVNTNITATSGTDKLVELQYNGMTVIQDDVKFLINVNELPAIKVRGEVNPSGIGSILKGNGSYEQETTSYNVELITREYINGYKFKNWTSSSSQIIPQNANNFSTVFTIPSKNTTVTDKEVVITANYMAPNNLKIINPQTEFILGDKFTLGNDAQIIVTYPDNSTKVISLTELELTSEPQIGEKLNEEGKKEVKIEYAGLTATYNIEVILAKYNLIVEVNYSTYGEISGNINDKNGIQKGTVLVPEDDKSVIYYQVSTENTVYLEAIPKDGYAFVEWVFDDTTPVEGMDLTKAQLTFTMPSNDIRVKGVFEKLYKVIYKVKNDTHGTIIGQVEQMVVRGGTTTPVTATPNDKYAFYYWQEDGSKTQTRSDSNITSDRTYTAVFTDIWTVTFYNEDTLFKQISVKNGESGVILDIPTKYAYVFTGWDKDLSSIKSNIVTYAQYVPRISINDEEAINGTYISANIKGIMIEEGTLQYIISDSPTDSGDEYFDYELEGATIGDWYNTDSLYRSKEALEAKADSSSYLILTSANEKELVKFNYILASSTDSQLGITINGERVIGPNDNSSEWKQFSKEVDVVNGKIKIGISYSQGENVDPLANYAAIRNLYVSRQWTIIDNDYYLYIPAVYQSNYIHVKGTGSDDGELYTAVSGLILMGPTAVELSPNSIVLDLAGTKTQTVTATLIPDGVTSILSWTTSNSSVATVSEGTITGQGKGSAVITVTTDNGKTTTCSVTVTCSHSATTGGSLASPATCTSAATYYHKCSECGAELSTTYSSGNALGHSWSGTPTCTSGAYCTRSGCNATKSALGHIWSGEPTCTTGAYCTRSGCNATKSALEHSWSGTASCTSIATCRRCNATSGGYGHYYTGGTCITPSSCIYCSDTGSTTNHSWSGEASCTTYATCTVCGTTSGGYGHNYVGGSCTTPGTCSYCGATGSTGSHSWSGTASCTTKATCTRCGATEGNYGHDCKWERLSTCRKLWRCQNANCSYNYYETSHGNFSYYSLSSGHAKVCGNCGDTSTEGHTASSTGSNICRYCGVYF